MVAGQTVRVDVWRMNAQSDDYAGGAVLSGTVVHNGLSARFQGNPDDQFILQQGLETQRTYTMNIWPGNKDIRERDEIQVIWPTNYPYLDDKFRVASVRYSDFNDRRKYMMLDLTRLVRAHKEQ